jgi:hypothetical protein
VRVLAHSWPAAPLAGLLRVLVSGPAGGWHEQFQRILPSAVVQLHPPVIGQDGVFLPYQVGEGLEVLFSRDLGEFADLPTLAAPVEAVDALAGGDGVVARVASPVQVWLGGADRPWRRLALLPECQSVQGLAMFADHLWLATGHGPLGFSLWRAPAVGAGPTEGLAWRPVLTRGAWRYSVNREVTALLVLPDALLLAVAATGTWHQLAGNHGPEILAVTAEGAWEIVVGHPRFTPDGFKVPLAPLGAGFGDPDPAVVTALVRGPDGRISATVRTLDNPPRPRHDETVRWETDDLASWRPVSP